MIRFYSVFLNIYVLRFVTDIRNIKKWHDRGDQVIIGTYTRNAIQELKLSFTEQTVRSYTCKN